VGQKITFNKIIETPQNNFLSLHLATYDPKEGSYPGYDMSLEAEVQPLIVTYIHSVVMELLEYSSKFKGLNNEITAITEVTSSQNSDSSSLQESQAQVQQTSESTPPKFLFNVRVISPVARAVPSHTSLQSVYLDFGTIEASNQFILGNEKESDLESKPLYDFKPQAFSAQTNLSLPLVIHASVVALNMKIQEGDKKLQTLLTNFSASALVSRRLDPTVKHLPSMEVSFLLFFPFLLSLILMSKISSWKENLPTSIWCFRTPDFPSFSPFCNPFWIKVNWSSPSSPSSNSSNSSNRNPGPENYPIPWKKIDQLSPSLVSLMESSTSSQSGSPSAQIPQNQSKKRGSSLSSDWTIFSLDSAICLIPQSPWKQISPPLSARTKGPLPKSSTKISSPRNPSRWLWPSTLMKTSWTWLSLWIALRSS